MKKIKLDDIILQIIFFAAGIYILFKIFIPLINPATIATNSSYDSQSFYEQMINKANSTVDVATTEEDENSTALMSVLFTYLTGIDLSNPQTFIASQLPILGSMDITSIDSKEAVPIVVVPAQDTEDEDKPDNNKGTSTSGSNTSANNSSGSKGTGNNGTASNPNAISTVNPAPVTINKKLLNKSNPSVLILHTHTTESYNPGKIKGKNFSNDLNTTVAKVGDMLEYDLENKYGISTVHDSTIHDLPKRLGAYEKSRPTIKKYLKKYPNLKLIIDLHRDGEVKRVLDTALINKEKYARVMLVAGTKFKNHDGYNKTTQKIFEEFNKLYPNFCRGISYKNGIYNQDLNPNMILLEVGSNENSMDEALRSTEVIAKVIAKYLK